MGLHNYSTKVFATKHTSITFIKLVVAQIVYFILSKLIK